MKNTITSTEQFYDMVLSTFTRAKDLLVRDDDLRPVALLRGPVLNVEVQLLGASVPRNLVSNSINGLLQQVLRSHPTTEYVLFASLAVLLATDDDPVPQRTREAENTATALVVEANHREWGRRAAGCKFFRASANRFTFEPPIIGLPRKGSVLDDLWPPRRLNS